MGRRARSVILLLLLLQAVPAVVIEEYLYPGEKRSDIAITPLITSLGNYSLVKIRGNETFLIKNASFVLDTAEISNVLADHYLATIYPKEEELAELLALLKAFNDSRDGISTYGLRAESTCRMMTGMDRYPCYDRKTCVYACAATFQCGGASNQFAPLFGLGESFVNSLVSLGIALNQTDTNIELFVKNIQAINATKNYTQLLASNVTELLNASYFNLYQISFATRTIKDNPIQKDSNEGGFDYCPRSVTNLTILEVNLTNKVLALRDRTLPIASIPSIAARIHSSTLARQDYVRQVRVNEEYEAKYANVSARLQRIKASYANASRLLAIPEMGDEIELLQDKALEARGFIDVRNYSLADLSISQFHALAEGTESALENYTAIAAAILALQKDAGRALLKAEWELEVQNFLLREQLAELRSRKAELDDKLSLTIKPENASAFANAYREIIFEANDIVATKREQAHEVIVDTAVLAARSIVMGVDGLAAALSPPSSFEERKARRSMVLPAVIALADLLLIAAAAAAFTYLVVSRRLYLNRQAAFLWTGIFVAFFFVIALASFSIHLFFQSQASSATLDAFLQELAEQPAVAVISDETNAWSPASVRHCARELSSVSEMLGKSVTRYLLIGEDCIITPIANGSAVNTTTKSIAECQAEIGTTPVLEVRQSDINATTFHTFYETRMMVAGDEDYLLACDVAKVMRE
ncbi:MAG: hypothetical protein QXG98_03415 [Candidatus Micrarchaeia archaeon]